MLENPYDSYIFNKNQQIDSIEVDIHKTQNILTLLKKHTASELQLKIIQVDEQISHLSQQWDNQKLVFDDTKAKVKSIEKEIESQWFISKLIKSHDASLKEAKTHLASVYNYLNQLNDSLKNRIEEKRILKIQVNTIISNEESEQLNRLDSMVYMKLQLMGELSELLKKKMDIDQLIEPMQRDLRVSFQKIDGFNQKIKDLSVLQNELNQAENGYERKQIHEICEREHGDGNPSKVKSNVLRQLEAEKRQCFKIESRGKKIIALKMRAISCLIIDGNNLCYEGSKFIGLNGLIALSDYLVKKGYQVIIVFDASIRRQLQMDDNAINYNFAQIMNLNTNKIHVVPTKSAADGVILEIASDKEEYYVISNDRFKDFPDKAVVVDDRLIRHNIVNQKIIIEDLQISINLISIKMLCR